MKTFIAGVVVGVIISTVGFSGVAQESAGIARILFLVFLIIYTKMLI
jgi:uncharacterized membrane protein YtjA (UPF0391 family)